MDRLHRLAFSGTRLCRRVLLCLSLEQLGVLFLVLRQPRGLSPVRHASARASVTLHRFHQLRRERSVFLCVSDEQLVVEITLIVLVEAKRHDGKLRVGLV